MSVLAMVRIRSWWAVVAAVVAIAALVIAVAGSVVYGGLLAIPVVIGLIIFVCALLVVLRQPLIGLYVVVFLLPFERIGSIDVAGLTVRLSQIFALATIVAWILTGLGRGKLRIVRNELTLSLSLYVIAMLVSLLYAPHLSRGVMVMLVTLFVIGFSMLIPQLVVTREHVRRILVVLFVSACIVSVFGLYQFLGDVIGLPRSVTGLREQYTKAVFGFPRVQSTALEPLYFANYLLIPFSLALAFFLEKKQWLMKRWWLFGLIVLFGLNLVLTLSRGGYLAAVVVVMICALYYARSFFTMRNVVSFVIGGFAVLVVVNYLLSLTGLSRSVDVFLNQASNYSDGAGVVERFSAYELAIDAFIHHPVTGVGVGNFGPYVSRQPFTQPEHGWPIVNNAPLEILAETGVFGLFAIALLVFTLVIRAISAIRACEDGLIRTALIGFLVAFFGILVQYQTFSVLFILHVWFVVGMIVALMHMARSSHSSKL
jgi:putative inorganic carbon (hco3(-)) transporter